MTSHFAYILNNVTHYRLAENRLCDILNSVQSMLKQFEVGIAKVTLARKKRKKFAIWAKVNMEIEIREIKVSQI